VRHKRIHHAYSVFHKNACLRITDNSTISQLNKAPPTLKYGPGFATAEKSLIVVAIVAAACDSEWRREKWSGLGL